MKYRKLRIAWSVAWGLLAVLLCVLFVRSYWRFDIAKLHVPAMADMTFESSLGQARVFYHHEPDTAIPEYGVWSLEIPRRTDNVNLYHKLGVHFRVEFTKIVMPLSILVLLAAIPAAAPWLSGRFSLRTLLIATTLVAVALWLSVWMRN